MSKLRLFRPATVVISVVSIRVSGVSCRMPDGTHVRVGVLFAEELVICRGSFIALVHGPSMDGTRMRARAQASGAYVCGNLTYACVLPRERTDICPCTRVCVLPGQTHVYHALAGVEFCT